MEREKMKITLTKAEVNHILWLLLWDTVEGLYYLPKDQFWKRHERIQIKLEGVKKKDE